MRKKILVILLIIACIALLLVPSCRTKTQEGTLSARMVGGSLCWDAYDGASYYVVRCEYTDGTGYSLKVKELSHSAPSLSAGDYLYQVTARNAKGAIIARSEEILYHLGKGSSEDPIEISTAEELLAITGSTTVTFGESKVTAPLHYRMTKDVDLTGKEVTPIGNSSKPFYGAFDGAGHKITGLSFVKCNEDAAVGLFGVIKNASIRNLTLENASILFDKNSGVKDKGLYFGLLVGDARASYIDNCHVTGTIDVLRGVNSNSENDLSVGGICGHYNSGSIFCSSFEGKIHARYACVNAGGICGLAEDDSPYFMMLNSMANAEVEAVGTAYNLTTGVSNAYARAGVLIGNVSHADRFASLVAVGSATASTSRDDTPKSNLTAGVFGRVNTNSNSKSSVPIYNLFYDNSIEKAAGNAELGTYASYVYPLAAESMRDLTSYVVGDRYGLDFDKYWTITEGEIPTLRKQSALPTPPAVTLTIRSETEEAFTYEFAVGDTFLPTNFNLGLEKTVRGVGYNLSTLFSSLGITVSKGMRVRYSAEGMEDVTITLLQSSVKCYLEYGVFSAYEMPADVFGGFYVIDVASVKTYDFTSANHLTITILPEKESE